MVVIADETVAEHLIEQRRAQGLDKYDEVWDGDYYLPPLANLDHQDLAGSLTAVFKMVIQWKGLGRVYPGINVSDREDDWRQNYRIPDVAVFLKETKAVNKDSHWLGGPDFAVEIQSPGDRTREKIDFYAAVGTQELLIINRAPWQLELLRLTGEELQPAGTATVENNTTLSSSTVPLTFELAADMSPNIANRHINGEDEWLI